MDIDKKTISKALVNEIRRFGVHGLIEDMYQSFCSKINRPISKYRLGVCLSFAKGIFDDSNCKNFDDWFAKLGYDDLCEEDYSYHDFETLLTSRDFMFLSFYLYSPEACYKAKLDDLENHCKISLRSSDNGVMEMDKMAVTTQSQASENDKGRPSSNTHFVSENDKVDEMAATNQSQESENDKVDEMAATTQSHECENDKVDELSLKSSPKEVMEMAAITLSQVLRDEIDSADSLDEISLNSSDNVVMEMDKMAATTQSMVLRDLIDSIGCLGEIPLPLVSSTFLPNIISFCQKNHIFHEHLDIVVKLLKSFYKDYKDWLTRFLHNNNHILSHLHEGADYLDIPSLLELTSLAMGDMNENTDEEISEWYGTLSTLRMLSSVGIIVEAF